MKEQKLYSIVMRHLSGIQKGIQHSHSLQEYNNKFGKNADFHKWSHKDLNVVVLQANTTDQLREASKKLKAWGIKVAEFLEPDLDNCLTSITFLMDEVVFDTDKYPITTSIPKELAANDNRLLKVRNVVKQFPLATN